MDAGKVDYAARLLAAIPAALRDALRDPEQAGAAMVALLLAQARSGEGAPAAGDPGRCDRRARRALPRRSRAASASPTTCR